MVDGQSDAQALLEDHGAPEDADNDGRREQRDVGAEAHGGEPSIVNSDGSDVPRTMATLDDGPHAGSDAADVLGEVAVAGMSTQSQLYRLYTSHFIATWSDRMWEFAVALLMMQIWPSSVSRRRLTRSQRRYFSRPCMGLYQLG